MRILLTLAVVLALALPGMAVADRATSSSSENASAQSKLEKKKKKKKQRKMRKGKRKAQSGRGAAVASDEVEVKGVLVSLTPPTVGTVSCVAPAGMSLSGFAVGDVVEMTCDLRSGTWTLRRLEHEDDAVDEREVKGTVQALSPLTVAGVACTVPTTMSIAGVAVGDVVEMKCRLLSGVWTATRLELEDDHDDRSNSGSGSGDDDDDDDDDNSGPGGGGDDDDD